MSTTHPTQKKLAEQAQEHTLGLTDQTGTTLTCLNHLDTDLTTDQESER